VSFATRLWITGSSGRYDLVATPTGGTLAIRATAVARYWAVSAIPPPTPGGAGAIHHVAIHGRGRGHRTPRTGEAVKIVPLATLASEYAGARRYL
jgi:hypothetical protein